MTNQKEIK